MPELTHVNGHWHGTITEQGRAVGKGEREGAEGECPEAQPMERLHVSRWAKAQAFALLRRLRSEGARRLPVMQLVQCSLLSACLLAAGGCRGRTFAALISKLDTHACMVTCTCRMAAGCAWYRTMCRN